MRSELDICCRAESVNFGHETKHIIVQAALSCADIPNFQLFANTLCWISPCQLKSCIFHTVALAV